jgi:hypothetical protein
LSRTLAPLQQAHRSTVEATIADLVRTLEEILGRSLIAYMTDVDRRTVGRWVKEETSPRADAEERLRVAYQVVQLLLTRDGAHTVRAWFIGLNPQLNDMSPADALRERKLREVIVAAKSFTLGG